MKFNVDLSGFRELERALAEDLPRATAKNALRRTAHNSMKRIEDRAKQLAPADDGKLRDSITTKNAKAKRQAGSVRFERSSGVEVLTGPTGRQEGGYGAFQEFGTVNMPANPYMRPSVDAEGQNVIDDVRDELTVQIDKAKARIARKAARAAKKG